MLSLVQAEHCAEVVPEGNRSVPLRYFVPSPSERGLELSEKQL
jgi:hypothetical protein